MLQVYDYQDNKIRVIKQDSDIWFALTDIRNVLSVTDHIIKKYVGPECFLLQKIWANNELKFIRLRGLSLLLTGLNLNSSDFYYWIHRKFSDNNASDLEEHTSAEIDDPLAQAIAQLRADVKTGDLAKFKLKVINSILKFQVDDDKEKAVVSNEDDEDNSIETDLERLFG